ncbi:MAG: methyl-accepting chemotaxis protein [Deltaproteobacteria bacterium]|nr:methyl-accepting chemotaxis protein [Deltaproteobacteria bacterium]
MNLQSIKTRFMGSYLFLLVLFILQIPIIYWVVSGMNEKYAQVEQSGSLRKRAVEITDVLNRHIMTGNETLEQAFQTKKKEYAQVIEDLKKGSKEVEAITDSEILAKLAVVEKEWSDMQTALDKAMEHGDKLRELKAEVEHSTNASTYRTSYLLERYMTAYDDKAEVGRELKGAIAATGGGSRSTLLAAMEANDAYHAKIDELLEEHTVHIVNAANDLTKMITAHASEAAMRGLIVLAVSVLLSAGLAAVFMWSTNTMVIKPLLQIKETVEDFANGDLTKRSGVQISFMGREIKDEIASLGESVDTMAEQMSGVIGRITDTSNHLASASEQLSTSSTQIAEGADRQSSQTTHVATAMEEMNATVIEVAKNSQQASESARTTQKIAESGGDVVSQAITAMQEVSASTSVTADTIKKLGKSSEEIGTIISVINDIADQTNLLALNAAIEAARAGEQGRGFAVVADEVRKLAERTTKATKEISGMIKAIQDETFKAVDAMDEGTVKVENGVKLANEAGDALKQIVDGVENVTDMIGHIATSAEEQSATTDEITQNMDSIAEVAKTNVFAIGEVSKATNELASLATELKDLVTKFRIAKEGGIEAKVGGKPNGKVVHFTKGRSRNDVAHLKSVENA